MRPLLRGLPRTVWAATAFFGASLLFWTVTIPMFRGPDEADHVSAALSWADGHEWPGYMEMPLLDSVINARMVSGFHWYTDPPVLRPSLAAADAAEVRVSMPFDELGEGDSRQVNKAAQHPPLYSMIVGSMHAATGGLPWDGEMWFFRLLSVLLVWPLPLLAAAIARRLGASRPVVIASALAVCAVPQLGVVGGSVNNDNLLNGAGAWVMLGLVVILTGDLRKRTAAWVGLASAVALLAKAWALPLVAVVALAYVVEGERRRERRKAASSLAVYCGVSMLGGWWWIRNLLVYGSVQPSGHSLPLPEPLPLGESVKRVSERFLGTFPSRFWATLSIKTGGENAYPLWIPTVLILVLAVLLVIAFVRSRWVGMNPSTLALVLVPTLLSLVIMVVEATRFTMRTGIPSGIQGRYLYGSITVIGVVAVLGLSTVVRRSELLPAIVGGFAVAFTVASVLRAISFHYGEARWSNPVTAFPDLLAWSPVPSAVVIAFLVAFLGCAVWVLWAVLSPTVRTVHGAGVRQGIARHRSGVT
ncbi:MAG: DUF2142 domain-containing protein [Demequinaceae bacterium]|nr:DUF2142 domain-containing protein [Demequinaceae bacterium]